jgi:hypothetical protein
MIRASHLVVNRVEKKKQEPEREKGNRRVSEHGEQGRSEFKGGGVANIVRWYKEVREKGNFDSPAV